MFGFLKKDNKKKLEKEYAKLMEKAVFAQRNGDIETYSQLSTKADQLLKEIERLETTQ